MKQRDDWHLTNVVAHEIGRGDPFAAAVRATRMPMVITDPAQDDNPIIFVNEAFQRLTGYGLDEILGLNCRFLQGPDTNRDDVVRLRAAIAAGMAIDLDLLNYRKDGTTFWNALHISPVRNEDGAISFFFASQMDVSHRVDRAADLQRQNDMIEAEVARRTAELEAALEAKTLLLHEVDHRVKNNLNMIGSLIRLQARGIGDPEIAGRLEAMLERVDALAMVHRQLYQADDLTRFDVGGFVAGLAQDVVGASGRRDIAVTLDVEALEVGSAHASAIGLVLNEVCTNAIKHAFPPERGGALRVTARASDGMAVIRIADDGAGMRPGSGDGLGRVLIERLSRQAGGMATWADASPGTVVTVTMPLASGR